MVQDFRSAYRASLCFILISTGFLPLSKSFQATLAAQAAHHPSHENWRKIIRGGDQSLRSRKFDDAIDKYQDAIDEAKKVKAEDSLLAQSYSSMARAYKEKRDLDKAEEYYRKALALRKSELGDDAENTLRNLEDLSYCLWAQRKYREVESVLKEVLDIKTRTGNKDIEKSLERLARIKRDQHKYKESNDYLSRVLALRQKELGKAHIELVEIYEQMARNYRDQGDLEKAEAQYKTAIELHRKLHGDSHLELTSNLDSLADIYMRQLQYDQAQPLYAESLKIRQSLLPEDNVDVLKAMQRLSYCYERQDNSEAATKLVEKEISLLEKSVGRSHIDVAKALNRLAHLQAGDRQYSDALKTAFQALEMRRAISSEKDPSLTGDVRWISDLYVRDGKFQDALSLLQRQEKIVKKLLGKTNKEYIRLLEAERHVLSRIDREDEAKKLDAQIKELESSS